jgi:hypothetical protein
MTKDAKLQNIFRHIQEISQEIQKYILGTTLDELLSEGAFSCHSTGVSQ